MPFGPAVAPAARQVIDAAFKALEKTIAAGDCRGFAETTLPDVRAAALEVEKQMSARGSLRNMQRLVPLFTGLEHYASVMEVLCNGTPYLPWLWAPIKLVLRVASEYVEAFEVLISAYARLAEALPRVQVLSRAFARDPGFQQTLTIYYADILAFHGHAYKFVHRRGWRLFFKTSWGRFERRFDALLENMHRHERLIDRNANALHIATSVSEIAANKAMRDELRAWREESNNRLAAAEREAAAAQFAAVVAWLKADESASNQMSLLDTLASDGARFPGTCSWLVQNYHIKSWLGRAADPSLLLVKGAPGIGKSVLAAQLVSFMRTAGQFAVCHFCSYAYASSITFDQVLRSLLLQLLRRDPELVAFAVEEYVRAIREPTVPVLQEMLKCFVATLSASAGDPGQLNGPGRPAPAGQPEHVWIVLDGLDECTPATQALVISLLRQLIGAFSSFSSSPSGRSGGSGVTCKVLIASRPTATIDSRLRRGVVTVSLANEKKQIAGAIRQYTQGRLEEDMGDYLGQLRVGPPELETLVNAIVAKADGMFLYARLVLNYLAKNLFYTARELLESVDELPAELAIFYRNVLNRVLANLGERSTDRLRCILGWIAFSKRPLKKLEFMSAVTFSQGDPFVEHPVPRFVLDATASLVEERSDTTLSFIHVSVKDFLQNPASPIVLSKQLAVQEHGIATVTCLLAGVELFDDKNTKQYRFQRLIEGLHGLHVYATEYWAEYLLAHVTSLTECHADGDIGSSTMLKLALRLAPHMERWLPSSIANSTNGAPGPAVSAATVAAALPKQARDARLSHLQHLPLLHQCVVVYLNARSLDRLETAHEEEDTSASICPSTPKSRDMNKNTNKKKNKNKNYQDGVTALLASYQATLGALLDLPDFPGISAADFRRFKSESHSALYTCRLTSCPRATLGFDSAVLRHEHEQAHLRRFFPCTVAGCYSPAPASAAALREHTRKYHNQDVLPRRPIRVAARTTRADFRPFPRPIYESIPGPVDRSVPGPVDSPVLESVDRSVDLWVDSSANGLPDMKSLANTSAHDFQATLAGPAGSGHSRKGGSSSSNGGNDDRGDRGNRSSHPRDSVPPRGGDRNTTSSVKTDSVEPQGPGSAMTSAAKWSRVMFVKGQDVVFKPKPANLNDTAEGFLGKVQRVLGEGWSARYMVKDEDPDVVPEHRQEYRTSARNMIPLPPPGQDLTELESGKTVLAMYPDSTSFYKAEVMSMDKGSGRVNLRFEGEENSGTLQEVERRFVVEYRN